ncbi:hypothetical protein C0993_001450, partial [Termitomyces sp. T159_Od127]
MCNGPQFCTFHHVCGNATPTYKGRFVQFPHRDELLATNSCIIRYVRSYTLHAAEDAKDGAYTTPVVDEMTGVRVHNGYWLRQARNADVIVVNHGPLPAPVSTYKSGDWGTEARYVDGAPVVDAAVHATLTRFLPSAVGALHVLGGLKRRPVVVWHGSWLMDAGCPDRKKRGVVDWLNGRVVGDEWTLYYNAQGLVIRDSPAAVGDFIASYVAKRIVDFGPTPQRPFVLGLPTGSSPVPTYKALIKLVKAGSLSTSASPASTPSPTTPSCSASSLPTVRPLPLPRSPLTPHPVDIPPENVHILDGTARDLVAECNAYEAKIKSYGGIELFLGGIGEDGHIAFNEPGSSLASRTRIKTLAYDTILANARFFGNDINAVPRMALTVGVATVMDSREVIIIVTGLRKAIALSKAIEEGVNHLWTVSALQMHPWALIVTDEDATS